MRCGACTQAEGVVDTAWSAMASKAKVVGPLWGERNAASLSVGVYTAPVPLPLATACETSSSLGGNTMYVMRTATVPLELGLPPRYC